MSTPKESADLILKLYELRREETMRKARDFMVTFDPPTWEDYVAGLMGPNSAHIRMVTTYWEMAAALVLNGAIDSKMFFETNGEFILLFARVEPYLPKLREMFQNPNFLKSLEQLVQTMPDARKRLDTTREMMRKILAMRASNATS